MYIRVEKKKGEKKKKIKEEISTIELELSPLLY